MAATEAEQRYLNEAALDPPPESSWGKLLALTPPGARVLDVGCGHGAFAAALRRLRGCRVTGIEQNETYAADARGRCDELLVGDVVTLLREGKLAKKFDVVIASDVLEHLLDPRATLERLKTLLVEGGSLLASIPNVTHLSVVAALASGRFPRTAEGLLDSTHVQFYGHDDVLQLFASAGYAARIADRVVVDPRLTEFRTDLGSLPGAVLEYLDRNPHSTTYQFIVRAVPRTWAQEADEGPTVGSGPASRPVGVKDRLVSELAAAQEELARSHQALVAKDAELKDLHAKLAQYHSLAVDKDKQLSELHSSLGEYHQLVMARDREILLAAERRSPSRNRALVRSSAGDLSRLRVLYVTDRDDAPFRYRCLHGCAQLRAAGAVANVARLDSPDLLQRISAYGVVVLFRLPWSERVAQVADAAHKSGATIAFEVDDLIFEPAVERLMPFLERLGPAEADSYRRIFDGLARTLAESSFCIAPTEAIARHARGRGKPVLVHPNLLSSEHLELSRFVAPIRRAFLRQALLGYLSGSNTHDGDLGSIAGAIAEAFGKHPDLSLLLIGHVQPPTELEPFSSRVLRVPYLDHRLYPWVMARCRAVLAPLEVINDFTDAKSALKVFEAGAFGVPAIVSPTAPYRAAVEHGVSGFVASSPADWTAAISVLCDRGTSLRMGNVARGLALAEHSASAWRGVLARALLDYQGRTTGRRPRLEPLEPPEAARRAAGRFREQARIARAAVRLALRTPVQPATIAASDDLEADALARAIAGAPRRDRAILCDGEVAGLALVDGEHPASEFDRGVGTTVLQAGCAPGGSILCAHDDAQLSTPLLHVAHGLDSLVIQARTRTAGAGAHLKLYWRAEHQLEFHESRCVLLPLASDERWHARAIALPAGALRQGGRYAFRLDPLDVPGEMDIGLVALMRRGAWGGARDLRRGLAARFLAGRGLEIGALQNPLSLPAGASVRYVDRLTLAEARAQYPELAGQPLVDPSIVCEADRLAIPIASEDFVVCNHVLEHMRDPLNALGEWVRVLRPGGHLYVSIPDASNPLDRHRPVTTFEHLLEDARGRRDGDDHAHYSDWTSSVHRDMAAAEQERFTANLVATNYSIHFHVFDRALFERVLQHACLRAGARVVELQENTTADLKEYIALIRKDGACRPDPPVTVIVPVYNAREWTVRCAQSVIRHATGDWRLVLVDDASTEPGVREALAELAEAEPRVMVLENERNLGFVGTANRGMREASGRDVLLLNSDTEVFEGFLDRLRAAATEDSTTGVLTPFSNNATICSVPEFPHDNPIPQGHTPESMARLVATVSRRVRPELPTGVGFCLYLRREVLDRIGLLDEETFGRGYGEDDDLCQRARKAGFKVRLCDDVFVYHKGKASFGQEGRTAESGSNAKLLEAKHPGYHAEIARFVQSNPLSPLHTSIRFHLPRLRPGAEGAILQLLHASPFAPRPGGSEFHVRDLVRALRLPRVVIAWPEQHALGVAEVIEGDIEKPIRYELPLGNLAHAQEVATLAALRELLEVFQIRAAHLQHLLRWPPGVGEALDAAGVPYVMSHHDFHAVCLNLNLYDYERRTSCPCRDPEGDEELRCLAAFARHTGQPGLSNAHRQRHRRAMCRIAQRARAHVFPSQAALEIVKARLELADDRLRVIEHGCDTHLTAPRASAGPLLRVAVVGEVAYPIKGAEQYLEILGQSRSAAIEWHVFGDVSPFGFRERLGALDLGDRLVLHGPYRREEISNLLARHGIDLCLIFPATHETFSYILSEALIAGIPVLAAARGALPDRLARSAAGICVEDTGQAVELLAELASDRTRLQAWTERARAFRHPSVSDRATDYRRLYDELGWLSAWPPADSAVLERLRALYAGVAETAVAPAPATAPASAAGGSLHAIARYARPFVPPPLRRAGRAVATHLLTRPLKTFDLFSRNSQRHEIRIVKQLPGGALCEALSDDPQFHVDCGPFAARPASSVRFRMSHQFPGKAFAQLFWAHDRSEPFSEQKSAAVELGPGDNTWQEYEIRLDTPKVRPAWIAGAEIIRLRFDPGGTPGRFRVGRLLLHR